MGGSPSASSPWFDNVGLPVISPCEPPEFTVKKIDGRGDFLLVPSITYILKFGVFFFSFQVGNMVCGIVYLLSDDKNGAAFGPTCALVAGCTGMRGRSNDQHFGFDQECSSTCTTTVRSGIGLICSLAHTLV